jgi:hypothetical protein
MLLPGSERTKDVLKRIRSLLTREKGLSEAQMTALSRVPPDTRLAELGVVLHDLCVKSAERFVREEHRRGESPFRDLPKSDLFHEMLVLNFWVFEWLFKGKRQALMDLLYRRYTVSFVWGRGSSRQELMDSVRGRFRTYDQAWDDYSGHQDVFARQVIGIIFEGRPIAAAPQAAFWLISHTDRTMKDFAEIKKSVDLLLKGSEVQPGRAVPGRDGEG